MRYRCLAAGVLATAAAAAAAVAPANVAILGNVTAKPSPQQLAYQAQEIGVMITWNWQTACAPPSANTTTQACQAGSPTGPLNLPDWAALRAWDFWQLNVTAWLGAAASFHAKYAVLVVDHMSGFTLWPTAVHNVSVASVAWRGGHGDVVAEYTAAAAAAGMLPGIFYSTHYNWVLGVNNYAVGWPRLYGGPQLSQAAYDAAVVAQLHELAGYFTPESPAWEVWFDGGPNLNMTPSVAGTVRSLFPTAICHSCAGFTEAGAGAGTGVGVRWMGNELGVMPLPSWGATTLDLATEGDPEGSIYAPPSTDTVLHRHSWFHNPGDGLGNLQSTCALLNVYLTSVGRASNLILNLAPNATGAVDEIDVVAYAEMGLAIDCLWSAPLGAAVNVTIDPTLGTAVVPWQPVAGALAPCAGNASATCAVFNMSAVLQEEMAVAGQRLAQWSLDACIVADGVASGVDGDCAGSWVSLLSPAWPAAATTGIGHKRIVSAVAEVAAAAPAQLTALRVTIASAYAWTGDGASAAQQPPFVLSRIALFDRRTAAIGACLPADCELQQY